MNVSPTARIVQYTKSTATACRELIQCAVDTHTNCMAGESSGGSVEQQWSHTLLHCVGGRTYKGTPLIRTPLGRKKVFRDVLISGCTCKEESVLIWDR